MSCAVPGGWTQIYTKRSIVPYVIRIDVIAAMSPTRPVMLQPDVWNQTDKFDPTVGCAGHVAEVTQMQLCKA